MPRNIEIKARIPSMETIQTAAASIATEGPIDLQQDDTFFRCSDGRLKLREFADGSAELIYYKRDDDKGPKSSFYVRTPVPDPAGMRQALALAWGEQGRVRKKRRLYLVGRTRIHLDVVEGLGDYLELEVVLADGDVYESGVEEAQRIMKQLGIEGDWLVEGAYLDLLADSHNHCG
jgi:predicted adenylyl cyclase CyaB